MNDNRSARSTSARSAALAAAVLVAGACSAEGAGTRSVEDPVATGAADATSLPDARLRVVAVGDPSRLVVAPGELCAAAPEHAVVDCAVVRLGTETVGWLIVDGGPAGLRVRLLRGTATSLSEFLTADDPENRWASVQVGQAELTGDTVDELVLGFRDRGADALLELAVVSLDPGVVLRTRLPHGRVRLSGAEQALSAYAASSPDGPFSEYTITVAVRDEAGGVEPARFVSDFLGTLEAKDVPSSEL